MRRCFDTDGCGSPSAPTMSLTGRSSAARKARMSRRRGSAMALNGSDVVAARAMHQIICLYGNMSSASVRYPALMCDLHDHARDPHFGFLVDTPEIRALIAETERVSFAIADPAARVDALKPAFAALLAKDGWLPENCSTPDATSKMGGGIGQYALYRAIDGSLCLFSLVVPVGASTPVHDHLAWGLVGIYRGRQDETVYRRTDDGRDPARAQLEVAKRQEL